MAVSRGKQFEGEIRKALLKVPNVSVDRIPDPMAGYAGIRNICDFTVYCYPTQFYFECKAFKGNTLNFAGMITQDQWEGLFEKSKIFGVVSGVFVWFIDHSETYFVPIQELHRLRAQGAKSLNIQNIHNSEVLYFSVPGTKRRVLFDYELGSFLPALISWAKSYWRVEG